MQQSIKIEKTTKRNTGSVSRDRKRYRTDDKRIKHDRLKQKYSID